MQWKFRIYVQPLDRVFHPGNALDAHIARVAVLYEDLRLENLAASEDSIPKLDRNPDRRLSREQRQHQLRKVDGIRLHHDECPDEPPSRACASGDSD
jgi:hypothetical protein